MKTQMLNFRPLNNCEIKSKAFNNPNGDFEENTLFAKVSTVAMGFGILGSLGTWSVTNMV